jgi:carboxymethylenebutenolidase
MKLYAHPQADEQHEYANEYLDRRQFLKQMSVLSGGTAACAVLLRPGGRSAQAQVIPENEPRLLTEYITYPGETGDIIAYAARPGGEEELPGVIVIHENTGLQPHIEDVTRRFALEGFHAIAPDALSPLGGTPASASQARSLLGQLNTEATVKNFAAAVRYLKTHPHGNGKVGCTGFCWGGGMTNQVAVNSPDLDAGVPFYGSQPASADVPKIRASMFCHYAGLDTRINEGIEAYEAALRAASIDYGIYLHRGANHAFFNDSRPDRYHPEAAELAWNLTIAFFRAKLRDHRLVAHYKLDETEGDTARDSAGGHDGTLYGEPIWWPTGGRLRGALQLDGQNDCIRTDLVLDPAAGAFSAFAWIKGGAPGQVIVSQIDGVDWLLADDQGNLMTRLSQPAGGRQAPQPLVSPTGFADGDWHRVGFVWDGSTRALYVDDVLVAEDSQPSMAGAMAGLNIGCGTDQTPGSFFSGLIDDVRVYNQAVKP